ncbi:MAG: ATP-binding cassette domain-containing protein [Alkalibacterium sp.]|uniref:Peptide/nickel transport system ATP-binding protein n=1 Tax=Alkalibacterium gilvum TaxID=1130080 RepID=A0A1H6R0J5_9LACT|nr:MULTISPECIES: ATP-binding cassette domain-containing protein [Alkalibacterium]MDN6293427.1 ATP-binding cassette domain-containing protein [Alkalibacterium sp.]MDN6295817.1 ATP-binding cassette domain-containing protein [Alkalibacterium sp.]MDN6327273.1 ATP-binding cassette domain-containing protein [Alkalibacterium sp.]MDN6398061.1 ATP-binding cassette domain-containing protein [Alkalibacterium sp.]MDN6729463.1 ATP-binding cassette domain-containing protein [Alkalibacterium sp.]
MGFLEVRDLKVHYPIRGGVLNRVQDHVKAVDGVNLSIESGKTYGLVGESGSGKTTIGKTIIGLEKATSGKILYEGEDVTNKARSRNKKFENYNKDIQMIFQDATSSMNPKKRIIDVMSEPMRNYFNYTPQETKKRVADLLEIVGMNAEAMYKYPHEFSGGQRQRIGVARAVASDPKLIIADEPTSALDLSVQAQVLNFMRRIQKEYDLSYLFISHDLGVVQHMSDDIAIMHRGRFVEQGSKEEIYKNPQHIYTKRLLSAIPDMDPTTRAAHKVERQRVEAEYDAQETDYYDPKGRVYDLQRYDEEHYVALKPEEPNASLQNENVNTGGGN